MKQIAPLRNVVSLLVLSSALSVSVAQTVPVGTLMLDDYYRRAQLLGKVDSSISFNVRPLAAVALGESNPYNVGEGVAWNSTLWEDTGNRAVVQVMPFVLKQQVNTKYPHGWNDGAMIPARGYQMYLSAGIYAKYKFLSVQLNPEVVLAQNKVYEGFGGDNGPNSAWYGRYGNRMDYPEIFGLGAYARVLPGQSSVRVTFDPISVGLSTENLWWGPGRKNSIIMSNTAPGFAHLTLNTTKPIATYIGSFEGQIVAGRLEQSGYLPSLLGDTSSHIAYYRRKPDTWRYLSGIVLSYQPKWVPGLSLGMNRAFMSDGKKMGNSLRDYFPIIVPALKKNESGDSESSDTRDQVISFFFRWAIPKAHAEIYGEYARNDHAWDNRDLTVQLDHTRAYTVGLRKLVPLSFADGAMLQLGGEVTQLAVTNTRRVRQAGTWYGHHEVRDGYTHMGQLLGAGIGPGSNSQSVEISLVKGLKQVGIEFERLVHNEDFARDIQSDFRRNWVDAGVGAFVEWDYGKLLGSFGIKYIHAYNYQFKFVAPQGGDYWGFTPQDNTNFSVRLGLMYRL